VDVSLDEAEPDQYDGLVLPGGVINPDALRLAPQAIEFVRYFVDEKRPIAAICHGPWTLIDAGGANGKNHDVLAFAEDGSRQRRRPVGG